ncbi:hypothetical protein, partial [Faecalibaculum rodentium]|uniref:hypothetical protein n=1 Tax=Faecalibaculum rodentium TaxID=1702221 RepID=UPI00272B9423
SFPPLYKGCFANLRYHELITHYVQYRSKAHETGCFRRFHVIFSPEKTGLFEKVLPKVLPVKNKKAPE